jgi:hypothetical protein
VPDRRLIPFEAYDLFHRIGRGATLAAIRAALDAQHAARRGVGGVPVAFRRTQPPR